MKIGQYQVGADEKSGTVLTVSSLDSAYLANHDGKPLIP